MRRSSAWLVSWVGGGILAAGVGLGGYAGWLAAHAPVDFAAHRREMLQKLGDEKTRLEAALAAVQQRWAKLAADLATEKERAREADRAITALRAGDSWWRTAWDRLFGNAGEVRTKEERLARLEAAKNAAASREAELRPALTRATWERDGAEIDLGRVDRNFAAAEGDKSTTGHYLTLAWNKSRWYVVAALTAWFLGPAWWRRGRRSPTLSPKSGVPKS